MFYSVGVLQAYWNILVSKLEKTRKLTWSMPLPVWMSKIKIKLVCEFVCLQAQAWDSLVCHYEPEFTFIFGKVTLFRHLDVDVNTHVWVFSIWKCDNLSVHFFSFTKQILSSPASSGCISIPQGAVKVAAEVFCLRAVFYVHNLHCCRVFSQA